MIKRTSAKQKGRQGQNEVVNLLKTYLKLTDDQVRSTPSSVKGEDIIFNSDIQKELNISIEVKRQEKLNIWDSLLQAFNNAKDNKGIITADETSTLMEEFKDYPEITKKITDSINKTTGEIVERELDLQQI